jgi:hypothetical protein
VLPLNQEEIRSANQPLDFLRSKARGLPFDLELRAERPGEGNGAFTSVLKEGFGAVKVSIKLD